MNKVTTIISLMLLMAALVGGVFLVRKNQETRRGATAADVSVTFLPGAKNLTVGENVEVTLVLDTGSVNDILVGLEAKVAFDRTKLSYVSSAEVNGSGLTLLKKDGDSSPIDSGSGDLDYRLVAMGDEKAGVINVVKITFKAKEGAAGTADVTLTSGSAEMRVGEGSNPWTISNINKATYTIGSSTASCTDSDNGKNYDVAGTATVGSNSSADVCSAAGLLKEYYCEDGQVKEEVYTCPQGKECKDGACKAVETDTSSPVLNFKVAFGGISGPAACAVNWPLSVIVLGNGSSQVYRDVKADGENKVSMRLVNFGQTNNLAVFVKGPKHLQMKYGKDGQDTLYDRAGGEIGGLTTDAATSPLLDFSKLPMMAGDVTGETDGVPDGVIDGRDFAYVKSIGLLPRDDPKRVAAAGGYLQADLDGNCVVLVSDVIILMRSLEEKQGQLY